ncbi:monocarboxylate transporter 9-like [Acanthaster planci]|uniref:Monocarboxylate transporter 9-like n=1 Tax=Acanthaster planci TaxID=133434 RepID=A0A8B7YB29_ACAPL|nr:monocarboxylate transporter 9-like [Acanthaster planci]
MVARRFSRSIAAATSVFVMYFLVSMTGKALGMLLVPLRDDFGVDTWVVGTVFALVDSVSDLTGPIASFTGKKFGNRLGTIAGGCMVVAGFVVSSLASKFLYVALSISFFVALGISLTQVLTVVSLGQHFNNNNNRGFALALGIGKSAVSISLVCSPPLIKLFIDTYGWRATMLLQGSICAHYVVSGVLLGNPSQEGVPDGTRPDYERLPDDCPSCDSNEGKCVSTLRALGRKMGRALDWSPMTESDFWMITVILVMCKTNKNAWIIYFVPAALRKGFTLESAAVMVTVAGIGGLAGTFLASFVVYTEKLTTTAATVVATILAALPHIVNCWMVTDWLLMANAFVLLTGVGAVFTLVAVMLKEYLGQDRLAQAMGWSNFFAGLFRCLGGFIPGFVYDHTGSYDFGFAVIGILQLIVMVPLLLKSLRSCR